MKAMCLLLWLAGPCAAAAPEETAWAVALDPDSLTFDPATLSEEERRKLRVVINGIASATRQIPGGEVRISGVWQQAGGSPHEYVAELLFSADGVRWRRQTPHGTYLYARNSQESFTIRPSGSVRQFVAVQLPDVESEIEEARPIDVLKLPCGPWWGPLPWRAASGST